MQIVRLNPDNRIKILSMASEAIKRGETVVYPTETAYGLGADFYSGQAYNKILAIKGRPQDKALPLIVSDINQAASLVKFSSLAWELANKYWPGPLTLVLPATVSQTTVPAHQGFLAIRVSSHPLASALARIIATPLVSTSANLSAQPPCYTIADFSKQFRDRSLRPDLVIDAGRLPNALPSTIIKIDNDKVELIRQGSIKIL